MKHYIVEQCLNILKRDDIQIHLRLILNPVVEYILTELRPYIYTIAGLLFLLFLMNLSVFIVFMLWMRNKYMSTRAPAEKDTGARQKLKSD